MESFFMLRESSKSLTNVIKI